ncbi:unnamed protein product, partial [Hapterophycus canaliculatus]
MMAAPTTDRTGCWRERRQEAQAQARRERAARSDQRSRDIFRGISHLKARVELEDAQRNAKQIARRNACGGGGGDRGSGSKISETSRFAVCFRAAEACPKFPHSYCSSKTCGRRTARTCGKSTEQGSGKPATAAGGEAAARATSGGNLSRKHPRCGDDSVIDLSDKEERSVRVQLPAEPAGRLPASTVTAPNPSQYQLTSAAEAVQRRPWGTNPPQRRPRQQENDFAAAAFTLQQGEWGRGGEKVAKASAPVPASTHLPLGEGGKSCVGQNQQQHDQPPFVVVGLIGEFGDRVLLLPTTRERRHAMRALPGAAGERSIGSCVPWRASVPPHPPNAKRNKCRLTSSFFLFPGAPPPCTRMRSGVVAYSFLSSCLAWGNCEVPLTWPDAGGAIRTAALTRTKAKPIVCNPLPMLATLLAWMREFSPEALPEVRCPLLPGGLSPRQPSCSGSRPPCSSSSSSSSSSDAGSELSLAAAWLLAHLTFGRENYAEPQSVFARASLPPNGKVRAHVNLSGGEAAALALLRSPRIGWSPRP